LRYLSYHESLSGATGAIHVSTTPGSTLPPVTRTFFLALMTSSMLPCSLARLPDSSWTRTSALTSLGVSVIWRKMLTLGYPTPWLNRLTHLALSNPKPLRLNSL